MNRRNGAIMMALLCVITYRSFHKHSSTEDKGLPEETRSQSLQGGLTPKNQKGLRNLLGVESPAISRTLTSIDRTDLSEYCGTDEKCLKRQKHHELVRRALGGDAVGAGAYDLLTVKMCAKIQSCANGGRNFFATAISRLDPTTMAQERLILQRALLESSLTKEDKNSLLSELLEDDLFKKIQPTSQQTGEHTVQASQDAVYLTATQTQLIKSGADAQTVITSSLAAISNTQDGFAKGVMTATLLKRYPTQRDQILSSISK